MSTARRIVLDANIIIRAALGRQTRSLIARYGAEVLMVAPQVAYDDAARHLPGILATAKHLTAEEVAEAEAYLSKLPEVVLPIPVDFYSDHLPEANRRIADRDSDDAHILATALWLDCPIWTQDQDFFGVGVPIWNSQLVHIYLEG